MASSVPPPPPPPNPRSRNQASSANFQNPTKPIATFTQPTPLVVRCPYCQVQLDVRADGAGQAISCPQCQGRFQVPIPIAASPGNSSTEFPVAVKVPVLISGIANTILGLIWISTCFGVVIGAPMLVLAIFEFLFFAAADSKPRANALSNAKTIGICEIVAGLFNLVSLVCGILVLVFSSSSRT